MPHSLPLSLELNRIVHHDMEPAPTIGTEPDEQLLDRFFSIAERSDDSDDVPPLSTEALAAEARELMGKWSYTQSWLQHLAFHTGWSYNWMCGLLLPGGATDPFESIGTALTSSDRFRAPPRLRSSSWRLQLQSGNLVSWNRWSSLLEGQWPVSYSIVRLLETLDQLFICWTITVSASRTLLRRRCWSISLSMGDITPLLIGTFEPHPLSNHTNSGEDDTSDDEDSFFHHPTEDENCCLCLGLDAEDFNEIVCLRVCLLWLESYLPPCADAESMENKVFDRRDIGWTSPNTQCLSIHKKALDGRDATGVGAGDSQLGIWWVLVRSQIPCVVTVVLLTSRHGIRTIDSVLCCTFSMYWADTRIFTAMY